MRHGVELERAPLAQLLRLTPRAHAGQRVLHWSVRDERGRELPSFHDGFGNATHLYTPQRAVRVEVEGLVETRDTGGVLRGAPEPLPPAFFARAAPLEARTPDRVDRWVEWLRAVGRPARCTGGYLQVGGALTSHAWAEAWFPELGWVGFDVASGSCTDERYVRTRVGLDCAGAAPVRALVRGEHDLQSAQRQAAESSAQ